MKLSKFLIGLISIIVISNADVQNVNIEARGATFPKSVYAEWVKAYKKETGKTIEYLPTGSGDGITSAIKRVSDFSGSDKPLQPWRLKRYQLTMFPAIVGSIILAYNIPNVPDNALKLSEEAIGAIFSGKAKFWDDERITKYNPNLNLPHHPIKVVARKDESGTTYNFTYYLRKIAYADFKKAEKKLNSKADITEGEGSGGVAELVRDTQYAIGYMDYSNKIKYSLNSATIENKDGNWVQPTLQTAKDGAKSANLKKEKDFFGVIAYKDGKNAYPIVATSFVLLPYGHQETNKEIIDFFDWAFKNGEALANKHGFAMLPKKTIKEIQEYWIEKVLTTKESIPRVSLKEKLNHIAITSSNPS